MKCSVVVIDLPGRQAFVFIADNAFGVMWSLRKGFPLGNLGDHNSENASTRPFYSCVLNCLAIGCKFERLELAFFRGIFSTFLMLTMLFLC